MTAARDARARLRRPAALLAFWLATAAGLAAGTAGTGARPAEAAPAADTVAAGELHERITSDADPTASYALLLPPGYRGRIPRPLLMVLDPRGRAVRALEIFRDAAARRGWIAMSSYDTRSDTTGDGNERALRAMIADANARLAVDGRRLYLAGFSGTARFGWLVASSLRDHLAGLVGVGAGFPAALEQVMRADAATLPETFSFWGGAGRLDFNFDEVRRLDDVLDEVGVRHRIEFYPGGHGWLPREEADRAVDWLELQAMRDSLVPVDSALVDSLHRQALAAARAADAAGRPVEARERWRRVAEDFGGLRPVAEARSRARSLAGHPAVERHRERIRREAREREAFLAKAGRVLGRVGTGPGELSPAEAAGELGLEELRRRADVRSDSADALAAGRLLEQVYVQASFYLPRRALRAGDPGRALAFLELAERARPGRGRTRWFRARALAQEGRSREAMETLRGLVDGGFPRSALRSDPWLEPLRGEDGWEELVEEPPSRPAGG